MKFLHLCLAATAVLANCDPTEEAAAVTTPLVASLGSSYSAGYGLYESYGNVLADLLAKQAGLTAPYNNYFNYSQSGSNVTDVPSHATKLGGKQYAAVVITAGGNDLNYVACLYTFEPWCGNTITKDVYISRYTKALDSVRDNVDVKTPIYIVTYTEALGSHTVCPGDLCDRTASQVPVIKQIYNNSVDWTVDAYNSWKSANPNSIIKLIPMRSYSADKHDVGSDVPWCSGSKEPAHGDGHTWHPTTAGAKFEAQAIFNDIAGLPVPSH